MKPVNEKFTATEDFAAMANKVADEMAEAINKGPMAALRQANTYSDAQLVAGLDFITAVLEVASASARALADVQRQRYIRNLAR